MTDEKILSELPRGWTWAKVNEIAELIRGVLYPKEESSSEPKEGLLPILRATNIRGEINFNDLVYVPSRRINQYQFIRGLDIIIAMSSGSKDLVGKAAQAKYDFNGGFGTFCGLVRVNPLIDKKYTGFYFQSKDYREGISKVSSGVNINNLRRDDIEKLDIPLSPLPEQHRIVTKIEELFTRLDVGVEALKKIQLQLKRYRQSVLKTAFEGKLTAEWRESHKGELEQASVLLEKIKAERKKSGIQRELPPLDTTDLPELPEVWIWGFLSDLGTLNRGKSKHRPRNDERLFGGKYPFIQTGDIRNCGGVIRDFKQTYNDTGLQQSRLWGVSTLCITIAANIAETAILGIEACFPDSVVGFVANQSCEVKYVRYYMESIKNRLDSVASATAQKNINLDILNKVAIPIVNIKEQQQIVEEIERRFSVAGEIEETIDQNLKQSERLRQSILKRAFEGKLVSQSPDDEPAGKLLERIKAERAKMNTKQGRAVYGK